MKLINLTDCWIYSPETLKADGEVHKKWLYKNHFKLNIQQDINELDRNSAGLIDYDKIKIRADYIININKNDGISLYKLNLENNYAIESPKYIVKSKVTVGKCTTFICEINHGV